MRSNSKFINNILIIIEQNIKNTKCNYQKLTKLQHIHKLMSLSFQKNELGLI